MPVVGLDPTTVFAPASDLETLLQRTFSDAERAAAEMTLTMATNEARSITHQTLSYVEDDVVTLDPPNRSILALPELPVTAVSSLVIGGVSLTPSVDFYWYGDTGLVRLAGCRRWTWLPQSVVFTYSHGYDPVPDIVHDVVLEIAAFKLGYYKGGDGLWVKAESIGNYSVTHQDIPVTVADVVAGRLDAFRVLSVA